MVSQGSRVWNWTGRLVVSLIALALTWSSAVRAQEADGPTTKDLVERIERLERIVEKLIERDNSAQRRELTETRRWLSEQDQHATSAEKKIAEALEKLVVARFDDQPLSHVIETLGDAAGVNIVLRADGLAKEGCSLDQPITIVFKEPVTLNTALKQILGPLRLGHVIRNEVLEVASQDDCRSELITKVYNVADLVVPIATAHSYLVPSGEAESVWVHPVAMARLGPNAALAAGERIENQSSHKHGGTANPDFVPLLQAITEFIEPESWQDAGGAGAVHPSPTSLALVISQTQEVHEQIADLFEQLRRVLDEQVVLETRLVSLPEYLFERIGVDLAFAQGVIRPVTSIEVGEDGLERIGVDFDLPWSPGAVTSDIVADTGFAVLSPQQMKLLVEAVEEHASANILAAPKLTLFSGQRVVVSFGTIAGASEKRDSWSSIGRRRKGSSAPKRLSLSLEGAISKDCRNVEITAQPNLTSAAPAAGSQAPSGPQVRATVPEGGTLLVDAGELPGGGFGRMSQRYRLVVLVTPRIIVREEEEVRSSLGSKAP
jgi:hypothetical protein